MFKKLLVPLDRSPLAEQALGAAATIARASAAKIALLMVHQPVPYAGFKDAPWKAAQAKGEQEYLASIAAELERGASISTTHELLIGDVVETICEHAKDIGADLIVMTSHGRTGFSRVWHGSVADGVLRQSALPVLMLPLAETDADRHAKPLLRILVPLDGSAMSETILPVALDLARCSRARLSLLSVIQPVPLAVPEMTGPFIYSGAMHDQPATNQLVGEAHKQLAERLQALADEGFQDVDTKVVVAAQVAQTIIDFAAEHNVDAIAMSTHGRGASRLLVGSIADKVIRASRLPLLIRRPAGVKTALDFINASMIEQQLPAFAGI
jgi:nucleotide-binding universal stress UspA family protein